MRIPRMTNKLRLFGLLCGLIMCTSAVAQKGAFNPYTQLGIGSPVYNPVAAMSAMGGGFNALNGNNFINYQNPASYSTYEYMQFQFGFDVQSITATRNGATRKADLASFNQLAIGLPILKNRIGMAFGYTPYTNVGYNFTSNERIVANADTVDVGYTYEGNGGTDRFFIGFGGSPIKNWSIGFNTYFYLGNIDRTKTSYFPDDFQSTNIQSLSNIRIADFGFDFGTQYSINFKDRTDSLVPKINRKDKYRLTFGATYVLGKTMSAKNTSVARYFTGTLVDQFYYQDTIAERQKVKIQFPSGFGAGVSFGQPDYWQLQADFNMTMWSQFRYANQTAEPLYGNSYNITLGGEVKPLESSSKKSIFNKLTYRVGGRYGMSYLRPGGVPFQEVGGSLGIGIPILSNDAFRKKLASSLNVSFEYGMSIPGNNTYTQEQMFRFVFSFNLRNKWFDTFKFQ